MPVSHTHPWQVAHVDTFWGVLLVVLAHNAKTLVLVSVLGALRESTLFAAEA